MDFQDIYQNQMGPYDGFKQKFYEASLGSIKNLSFKKKIMNNIHLLIQCNYIVIIF